MLSYSLLNWTISLQICNFPETKQHDKLDFRFRIYQQFLTNPVIKQSFICYL